ncbi:RagB/SusD family nutrient uptake outer membrane protein [Ferruginibacter albus]|uniref:RagB/SusD family nutrient uptake outer membrane protein n=1 Tax=Ferruginibacter albus TaxID=2875540 RepID=UPI001CC3AA34|nr:RagB/SusD family nutrient uptake outer membrane protein [Ferruginibacter albus]UAY50845.1 RagB/SusD family nutrient uptake outer membrane protein [Ferruginibacter albus]
MNKLLIAVTLGIFLSITSCQHLDDIKPVNIILDDQIFKSEAGITTYFATMYRKLPIEDFQYRPDGRNDGVGDVAFNLHHEWEHFYHSGAACGEMVGPYGGMDIGGGFGYWPYTDIRNINYFIQTMPKYASGYTQDQVNQFLGEAYFCRAYTYFALAKRYGGVPIVTRVLTYPQQTIEELQVPRNTEAETWDFIGNDLDSAYALLPEANAPERANKYAAMALKSRAMVYAGSIAKYGSVNYVDGDARANGFVGIDAGKANAYYQKAIDAAKTLEGHYSLYRKSADKVKNYTDVFLDATSPENILVRGFYAGDPERCHSWDATYSPNSGLNYMTSEGLSRSYPTLEFVERTDSLNGITNPDGTPKRFDNIGDPFQNLEPRLRGTVYFPGDMLRGKLFDQQEGTYPSFSGTAADEVAKPVASRTYLRSGNHNTLNNGRLVNGYAGMYPPAFGSDDNTRTGFYVRKYIDYNKNIADVKLFSSTTPWIELRYAEVLLNRAEADIETGQVNDALTCLNDIRDRAGASAFSLSDMTAQTVQNERCKELAFEHHYWWDIRRWRIADVLLNNAHFKGIMPYYVANENKYIFLKETELFDRNYNFEKKYYYEPIPGGELAKNPNLYPNNPGY